MVEPGLPGFNLFTRVWSTEEIETVEGILENQLPGYVLVLEEQGTECPIDASEPDYSPPLTYLQECLTPLVTHDATEIECPLPTQPVYDQDADLRLYPVRPEGAPDDLSPMPVVISYSARQVVAFG